MADLLAHLDDEPPEPGPPMLSPPEMVAVVEATKAVSPHFAACDVGEEWADCPKCVEAYNRTHRHVTAFLIAFRRAVAASEGEATDG